MEEEKKRESSIDVLRRLKKQEERGDKIMRDVDSIIIDKIEDIKINIPKPRNLPEQRLVGIMHDIERAENKLKDKDANYLNLLHDLRKSEERFLKEVEIINTHNLDISGNLRLLMKERKKQIETRKEMQKESSNVKKEV